MRSNNRWVLIFSIIAVISIIFSIKYFKVAFPEASLDINIEREKAVEIAREFISDFNESIDGYMNGIIMDEDSKTKNFFDREFDAIYLDSIYHTGVKVWFWNVRFFRPLEKKEFSVYIDPSSGDIKGYVREIKEEEVGEKISLDSARLIATTFLQEKGINLSDFSIIEETSENIKDKKGDLIRIDHNFTWEKKGWDIKDAKYRLNVKIQGDKIGNYNEWVKVPEKWDMKFDLERSYNQLTQQIANVFAVILMLAAVFYFFFFLRKRNINLKVSTYLGFFVFIIVFLAILNSFPLSVVNYYQTTESYSSFYLSYILNALLNSLLNGLIIFIACATGEVFYRKWLKDKVFLPKLFSLDGFKTKEARYGVVMGYLFAVVHIGFVVLYYLLGKKFGFWTPTEISYSDAINTRFPWLFALLAFSPAFLEEFVFRLFAVSFLKKFSKSIIIAIIVSSFIFGFLHSNYPQQPFYARGIEVGIIAIVAAILMIRFGILSTITWHYAVDAFLIGFFLFRSERLSFFLGGIISVGIFFIPILLLFIRRKKVKDEELYNKNYEYKEKVIEEKKEEIERPTYKPFPKTKISLIMTGALILLIGIIFLFRIKPRENINITRAEAENISISYIKESGIDETKFRNVTYLWVKDSDEEVNYIFRNEGIKSLRNYLDSKPSVLWVTRFFIPLEREEFLLKLKPSNGEIHSYTHILPEEMEGMKLAEEDALEIALSYLDEKGIRESEIEILKKEKEEKENRTDYLFQFETNEKIGNLSKRIELMIQGDEVSGFKYYYRIPEDWQRYYEKRTAVDMIKLFLLGILYGLAAVLLIISFIRLIRSKASDFRRPLIIAGVVTFVSLIGILNGFSLIFWDYQTSSPLQNFIGNITTQYISRLIVMFALIFLLNYISLGFFRKNTDKKGFIISNSYIRDGFVSGLLGGFLILLFLFLSNFLILYLKIPVNNVEFLNYPSFDTYLPFLSVSSSTLFFVFLLFPIASSLCFSFQESFKKDWIKYILVVLAVIIFSINGEKELLASSYMVISNLVLVFLVFIIAKYMLKDNLLSYITGLSIISLIPVVLTYTHSGSNYGFLNGTLSFIFYFILIYVIVVLMRKSEP
jgi:membrane protease YdiL (CAAX protease family)